MVITGLGDEGVGEISGVGEGAGERSGGMGSLGGVEACTFVGEPEERRRVEFAEAAEEGAVGDDAAEAGGGG